MRQIIANVKREFQNDPIGLSLVAFAGIAAAFIGVLIGVGFMVWWAFA